MADTRQDFIQQSIENGYNSAQISEGLQAFQLAPLSTVEQSYIDKGLYGTTMLERLGTNANQFIQGVNTLGALGFDYAKNPTTRKAVNKSVGEYAQSVLSGNTSPASDFWNLMLTPYNTTVEEITTSPKQAVQDIVIGASQNPLDAMLDIQPGIGLLKSTKAGSRLEESARRIVDKVPGGKVINNVIAPSRHVNEVNELLNLRRIDYDDASAKASRAIRNFEKNADLETLIRNATTGQWVEGSEDITKRFVEFNKQYSKQLEELGLDPRQAKFQTVDQYIFETLNPNRTNNIFLQDIAKARVSPTKANLDKIGVESKAQLDELVSSGNKLYDKGRIAPITQRGLNQGQTTVGIDTPLVHGLTAERYLGNASIPDIARNYTRGMAQLDNEITTARLAQDNLNTMAASYGKKLTPDTINSLSKDEVLISPREFSNKVREAFANNKGSKVGEIIESLSKGNRTPDIQLYGDDLFAVPKDDIMALARSATRSTTMKLSPLLSTFKKAVLTKPEYVAINRLGNWTLGAIGGADYLEALKLGNRGQLIDTIPDYFKRSTSYHGLNPDFMSEPITTGIKRTTEDIKYTAEEFQKALKDRDYLKGLGKAAQILNRAQDYVANPLFSAEATFEVFDRAAVYLSEAKKLAKQNNVELKQILDRAKEDKSLQRQLVSRVNRVLGDYIGKNHYLNSTARHILGFVQPFNRIMTTGADVLLAQSRENPLRMQAVVRNPARIGQNLYQAQGEVGQPIDEDKRGGLIDVPSYSTYFPARAKYVDANPFNPTLGLIADLLGPVRQGEPDDFANRLLGLGGANLSWIAGLANTLQGKDRFGNEPVGPNSYKVGGQIITMDPNGNVIKKENEATALATTLSYLGNTFSPLVTLMNKVVLPEVGVRSGKGYYQPTSTSILGQIGDLQIPYLMEGRTDKAPDTTLEQIYSRMLGERSREIYPEFKQVVTPRQLDQVLKQRARRMIQAEQRREH